MTHTHCAMCGTMITRKYLLREIDHWYGNTTLYLCDTCYYTIRNDIKRRAMLNKRRQC